jgi:hypothetical protein
MGTRWVMLSACEMRGIGTLGLDTPLVPQLRMPQLGNG